jgi:hypothetical protein
VTPDLMEEGARRMQAYAQRQAERTASGGRSASFGRLLKIGVPDFTHGVALYLEDITVSFDGFKALNALQLTVNVGELRCIIGPNGAGKTTMMDCITGKTRTCCASPSPRSRRSASAASSRSPRCTRSSACSRTSSWRSPPTGVHAHRCCRA